MADISASSETVPGPLVTEEELRNFHAAHFSTQQTTIYAEQFLAPVEDAPAVDNHEEDADDGDDGLGYYDDGMKRTLTDEQIAMFRHSEIQALLRARRLAEDAEENGNIKEENEGSVAADVEQADAENDTSSKNPQKSKQLGKSKKGKKKKKSWFKTNVKPDLRKRTWDKVDEGLESLDYDEGAATEPRAKMQRTQISYED